MAFEGKIIKLATVEIIFTKTSPQNYGKLYQWFLWPANLCVFGLEIEEDCGTLTYIHVIILYGYYAHRPIPH